jgi:hypothetical protein
MRRTTGCGASSARLGLPSRAQSPGLQTGVFYVEKTHARMSASGPKLRFAASQQDVGNGGLSGRSAGHAATRLPVPQRFAVGGLRGVHDLRTWRRHGKAWPRHRGEEPGVFGPPRGSFFLGILFFERRVGIQFDRVPNRASRLLTVIACHRPPRAVAIPRAFSASAVARRDLAPAFCIPRMIGSTFAA